MKWLVLAVALSLAGVSSGCGFAKRVIAKDKMNQGVLKYNQGDNASAKGYFKSATEYVPSEAVAWLYYGATLVKDYKALEAGDKRDKTANESLEIFKKALELAKGNCELEESAMAYISAIYEDLANEDAWREWMVKRAESQCADKALQAGVYHSIAVKYWNCAYEQTTRYADKQLVAKEPFHYRNLDYEAARTDKQKIEGCISKGMEFVEKALAVDPEQSDVMFYKGLFYREKQKMTKNEADRKKFADEADTIAKKATEISKRKEAEAAAAKQAKEAAKT
jgi:hypothetical protein